MSVKTFTMAVTMVVLGATIQSYTGILGKYFDNTPDVYSKPFWYSVHRDKSTISYQAAGERYIECQHRAPITADLLNSNGSVVSRELVRRVSYIENDKGFVETRAMEKKDDNIIGIPLDDTSKPRQFQSNNFIIVTDIKTLEEATEFTIRSECFNTIDGRVLGLFGPFPIPKDLETIGYFPDIVSQGANKG